MAAIVCASSLLGVTTAHGTDVPGDRVVVIELSIDARDADGRASLIDVTTSWAFPPDAEVRSYEASDPSAGSFGLDANTLAWTQRSSTPVTVTVELGLPGGTHERDSLPASDTISNGADTSDPVPLSATAGPVPLAPTRDEDADEVPDDTDICIGEPLGLDEGDAVPAFVSTPSIDYALPGCGESVAVVLDGVAFPTGHSWLDLPARRALDRIAAALGPDPAGLREVAAFTDGMGSRARNLAVSKRRARAVRQYLLLRGVPPGHLTAGGYGEADPIADNSTPAGRARNRRVVLRPFSVPAEGR